jgi:hypothetical protein
MSKVGRAAPRASVMLSSGPWSTACLSAFSGGSQPAESETTALSVFVDGSVATSKAFGIVQSGMNVPGEQEAADAVVQLRQFIALYEGLNVQPGSRLASALARADRNPRLRGNAELEPGRTRPYSPQRGPRPHSSQRRAPTRGKPGQRRKTRGASADDGRPPAGTWRRTRRVDHLAAGTRRERGRGEAWPHAPRHR